MAAIGCGGRRARRSGVAVEEWALIASVVFTGLFSGLYAMLNVIFHQVMRSMDGPEFARFLRRFLTVARRSPFNYVVVIGMVLAPAVALIATDDAGSRPFVLTAIGLALTLGGNAVVSNRIAEPNYDRMLAWDPDHMPADWEARRRYYFKLNWIRAVATWTAFALFLAALVELL
jgi:hypothetical protein